MSEYTEEELTKKLMDIYHLMKNATTNHKKCPKERRTFGYTKTKIQCIDDYWSEFKQLHSDLLLKTDLKSLKVSTYFTSDVYGNCEQEYLYLKSDILDMQDRLRLSEQRPAGTAGPSSELQSIEVKLPRIELPKFSGSYADWESFEDTFTSLINNNKSLSSVQKLHYLKSCLSGEAALVIKHHQVTQNNYQPAWESLKNRYCHKRLIVNSILSRLFSCKKINSNSAGQLKTFIDTTKECLSSLKNMKIETDQWDPVIIFFTMQKLDTDTHKDWEDHVNKTCAGELPKLEMLLQFLENKIHTLELTTSTPRAVKERSYCTTIPLEGSSNFEVAAADVTDADILDPEFKAAAAIATTGRNCSYCDENHALWHCKSFSKLSPEDKSDYVKNKRLCYNCLYPGHLVLSCKQKSSCKICGRRHHSLLHQFKNKQTLESPEAVKPTENSLHAQIDSNKVELSSNDAENVMLSSHFTSKNSTALLATALVPVSNENGNIIILRALVDQGSQATFISERAAQLLGSKRTPVKGTITGVGSSHTVVSHVTHLEVLSRCDSTFKVKVKAYIMSTRITAELPTRTLKSHEWSHIEGLFLADPTFYQPGKIDMLLGVDVCEAIMKGNVVKGSPGSPCAQDTHLGWILFGTVNDMNDCQPNDTVVAMHHQLDLDNILKQMWEIDSVEKRLLTADEKMCERKYEEETTRLTDGRYVVKLPTKKNELLITQGNTREIALRRFYQLERRFSKNPQLHEEYVKVIHEYLELGHMEKVPTEEFIQPSAYLPHHAVVKQDKETTKVRVVFDASCKGSNDISLNEELLVGPQLQEDLRYLIVRWRLKRIAYISDCKQMYRSVLVKKTDADLQRIVWRDNSTKNIEDYRLLRVTFGIASAPYLAIKTLQRVADDEGIQFPMAAKTIKEDFYVDDLLSGADSLEEAIETARDVDMILKRGGFTLQKWGSNSTEFLKQISPSQRTSQARIELKVQGTVKTLGLSWNMGDDQLQFHIQLPPASEKTTKRNILADIQKLFDPLGWLGPAIVEAKMLMQSLWLEGLTWDEEINDSLKEKWLQIRSNLNYLNEIKLKRWMYTTTNLKGATIHGFCDASTKAYAAVVYLRVADESENIYTGIIAAKTRVAPVKPVSLPRLELCGAVLLSRLLKQIAEATRISPMNVYSWTDSKIVLAWIRGDPTRWNVFVSNRVVEILDNVGSQRWNHVSSVDNPADIASRGISMRDLRDNQVWWHGPSWLQTHDIPYNHLNQSDPELDVTTLELRKQVNTKIEIATEKVNNFESFDTLIELQRCIAYARRFLNFKKNPKNGSVTTDELDEALNVCIRLVQTEEFNDEIMSLKSNQSIKRNSSLLKLTPFLDSKNILKVGGRITHANIPDITKHPIILGHKNQLVPLLIAEAHKKTLHGGVQLMISYIRTRYWILRVKNVVKTYVHRCIICAKYRATNKQQLMASLPQVRVTPARPFLHSGVDFAGPIEILTARKRGAKCTKAYIAIFVCMSTKAVHLELVGNLSSQAFIAAFERFVARRGKCNHIWSDRGTNFVKANKDLHELWQAAQTDLCEDVQDILANDGVQWHFNPPYSPSFGGLWEAGVKSTKHHLRRIFDHNLTFEEMTTVLCQIEACLNSRPLCPIEPSNIDELEILTPGHFLIGEAPLNVPKPDLCNINISRLSHWQHTQRLVQHFWHRWQTEYLVRLNERPKWQRACKEFKVGEVVIVKDESLPPGKWRLGHIVEKHIGKDGLCRVYSLKSNNKIIKRSIGKLCSLPIND